MAVYYWVGGSGDWQDPAKWSTSSGGPGGAVVPLDTDDVIFDTNSSGGSYVVDAFGLGCKNLTASAPVSGTLTFNDARIFVRGGNFSIYSGCLWTQSFITVCSVDQSSDNTGVPKTYTADFNGSGTRTSTVVYYFRSSTAGDILNFCNSRTQTFANVDIGTDGRVNCTSANISIIGEPGFFPYASQYVANIVVLSGTMNVGPTVADGRSYQLSVYATTTLTATGLTVNARGSSGDVQTVGLDFYSYGSFATSVGAINYAAFAYGTVKVDTVGSVTINSSGITILQASDGSSFVPQVTGTTTVTANAYLDYALPRNFVGAVSVANGATLTSSSGSGSSVFSSTLTIGAGSSFFLGSGDYTFNGAVTSNGTLALPSNFVGGSNAYTATFNAASTFTYTDTRPEQNVVLNNTVGVTSGFFGSFGSDVGVNAALTLLTGAAGDTVYLRVAGALTSTASGTIAITAITGAFVGVDIGTATLAASFSISQGASGNATLNFGSGLVTTSTFAVSCTGSGYAIAVFGSASFNSLSLTNTRLIGSDISVIGGAGRSFVYNLTAACPTEAYISINNLTVTTPTCTITGVVSRRVNMFMNGGAINITGSTPTLSHVSFYEATINNGLSAFTGTRLGTDGLSSGFIPQTPAQKFLVLGGATAEINTAVWALTSGGATSVNNYPLPQDTVIVDFASGGGTLLFTDPATYLGATVYLGSLSVTDTAVVAFPSTSMLGNYICSASSNSVSFNSLTLQRSGISARSLTLDSNSTSTGSFASFIGAADSLNFIGTNNASISGWSIIILSGGNITLSPSVVFTGVLFSAFYTSPADANALNIDGSTTITTQEFQWGALTNVSTTNYTVNLYQDGFSDIGVYKNFATNTARNGSVVAIGSTATIDSAATTATNPIVNLRFQNTVPTNVTTITLNGNTFVQTLTSGNSTASNTARLVGAAGRTITKTNGGNVGVTALRVTNVRASPANTFYAVAPNSSLVGDTAGWTLGTPPSTPSGGFLLF